MSIKRIYYNRIIYMGIGLFLTAVFIFMTATLVFSSPSASTVFWQENTLIIQGTSGDNQLTLSLVDGQRTLQENDAPLQFVGNQTRCRQLNEGDLCNSAVDQIHLLLGEGDDILIVDFSNGNPIPDGGLIYDGGDGGFDALVIDGGWVDTAVYDYFNANDGRITLDDAQITYIGLEPISNSGTANNIIFNLPNSDNTAYLEDDGNLGNNMSQLRSGGSFELTIFNDPANTLTINGGSGSDALNIDPSVTNPIPTGGLFFNGNTGNDLLAVLALATVANTVTHEFKNANDGSIDFDGSVINYTGLEPIYDNILAQNRMFDFPDSPNIINFSDSIFAGEGSSRLTSNNSETVEFRNPDQWLMITGGNNSDKITVTNLDPLLTAHLDINGGGGDDILTATMPLTTTFHFAGDSGIDTGTLFGTPLGETLNITSTDAGIDIIGGATGTFTFSSLDTLNIDLLGGNDDVTFTDQTAVSQQAHIILDAGAGIDSLQFNGTSGSDDLTLIDGDDGLDILGSSGATFTFANTEITHINTGLGDDTLTIDFSKGNPLTSGGVTFKAGDPPIRTGDRLRLIDGIFDHIRIEVDEFGNLKICFDISCNNRVQSEGVGSLADELASDLRSFSIDPGMNSLDIFTDGFESGDVTVWSRSTPDNLRAEGANAFVGTGTATISGSFINPSDTLTITMSSGNDQLSVFRLDSGFALVLDGGDGVDTLTIDADQPATIINFETIINIFKQFLPLVWRS